MKGINYSSILQVWGKTDLPVGSDNNSCSDCGDSPTGQDTHLPPHSLQVSSLMSILTIESSNFSPVSIGALCNLQGTDEPDWSDLKVT